MERGESVVDAVIREMKEETGLTVLNPKLCGIKQFPIENGRYLVLLFRADKFEGEVVSSEEGAMHWISKEEFNIIPPKSKHLYSCILPAPAQKKSRFFKRDFSHYICFYHLK